MPLARRLWFRLDVKTEKRDCFTLLSALPLKVAHAMAAPSPGERTNLHALLRKN